jgi:DNA-binding NtrC family response regulator
MVLILLVSLTESQLKLAELVPGPRHAVTDKSILIVDDEENLLLLLERILSRQGYKVVTAKDSRTALSRLERGSFDIAIIDVRMFPIDGISLLDEVKKRHASTVVIMVSAYPSAESRSECLKRGASAYLAKPLDLQELKSTVMCLVETPS